MKQINWEKVAASLREESDRAQAVGTDASNDGNRVAAAMMNTISGVLFGIAKAVEAGINENDSPDQG